MDEYGQRVFHGGGPLRVIMAVIAGIFMASAVSLITGVFIMFLWNWVVPVLFGLHTITFWQAFALSLLVKLLTGGFSKFFPGGPGRRWQGRHWREFRCYKDRFDRERHFDDVYEEWWEKEGSESFDNYIKKNKESKEEK